MFPAQSGWQIMVLRIKSVRVSFLIVLLTKTREQVQPSTLSVAMWHKIPGTGTESPGKLSEMHPSWALPYASETRKAGRGPRVCVSPSLLGDSCSLTENCHRHWGTLWGRGGRHWKAFFPAGHSGPLHIFSNRICPECCSAGRVYNQDTLSHRASRETAYRQRKPEDGYDDTKRYTETRLVPNESWQPCGSQEGSRGPVPSPHHLRRASQEPHSSHGSRSRPQTPKEKLFKKLTIKYFIQTF